MPLHDQVAIITGGGSGIGRAMAQALAREGVRVVIASRRQALLDTVAAELSTGGHTVIGQACDLRDLGSVQHLVGSTVARFGRLDLVINNSGLAVPARLDAMSNDQWDTVMDTNLRGAFWLTREAMHQFRLQGSGDIVNISSQAGLNGYADVSSYCASKFGLLGLGEALRQEVKADNLDVRVFNLCPGMVDVDHTGDDQAPRPGAVHVRTMAQTLLFLLHLDRNVVVDDLGIFAR